MGQRSGRHAHAPATAGNEATVVFPITPEETMAIERIRREMKKLVETNPLLIQMTHYPFDLCSHLVSQDLPMLASLQSKYTKNADYDVVSKLRFADSGHPAHSPIVTEESDLSRINADETLALWSVLMKMTEGQKLQDKGLIDLALQGINKEAKHHFDEVDTALTNVAVTNNGNEETWPTPLTRRLEIQNQMDTSGAKQVILDAFDRCDLSRLMPSEEDLRSSRSKKGKKAKLAKSMIEADRAKVLELLNDPLRVLDRKIHVLKHGDPYSITDSFLISAIATTLLDVPQQVALLINKKKEYNKFHTLEASKMYDCCVSLIHQMSAIIENMWEEVVATGRQSVLELMADGSTSEWTDHVHASGHPTKQRYISLSSKVSETLKELQIMVQECKGADEGPALFGDVGPPPSLKRTDEEILSEVGLLSADGPASTYNNGGNAAGSKPDPDFEVVVPSPVENESLPPVSLVDSYPRSAATANQTTEGLPRLPPKHKVVTDVAGAAAANMEQPDSFDKVVLKNIAEQKKMIGRTAPEPTHSAKIHPFSAHNSNIPCTDPVTDLSRPSALFANSYKHKSHFNTGKDEMPRRGVKAIQSQLAGGQPPEVTRAASFPQRLKKEAARANIYRVSTSEPAGGDKDFHANADPVPLHTEDSFTDILDLQVMDSDIPASAENPQPSSGQAPARPERRSVPRDASAESVFVPVSSLKRASSLKSYTVDLGTAEPILSCSRSLGEDSNKANVVPLAIHVPLDEVEVTQGQDTVSFLGKAVKPAGLFEEAGTYEDTGFMADESFKMSVKPSDIKAREHDLHHPAVAAVPSPTRKAKHFLEDDNFILPGPAQKFSGQRVNFVPNIAEWTVPPRRPA